MILDDIIRERERQDSLHPYRVPDSVMLTVLVEEVGEVARAMIEEKPEELRTEVLQCAAVCVKWLELLDKGCPRDWSKSEGATQRSTVLERKEV